MPLSTAEITRRQSVTQLVGEADAKIILKDPSTKPMTAPIAYACLEKGQIDKAMDNFVNPEPVYNETAAVVTRLKASKPQTAAPMEKQIASLGQDVKKIKEGQEKYKTDAELQFELFKNDAKALLQMTLQTLSKKLSIFKLRFSENVKNIFKKHSDKNKEIKHKIEVLNNDSNKVTNKLRTQHSIAVTELGSTPGQVIPSGIRPESG